MQHGEASFSTSDGLTLYRQWWHPDHDPRAVVMLLHGLGEHSGRYTHVAARLVAAGYAVEAVDHRGHGRSEGTRVFVRRYDEFMADLATFRTIVTGAHPGRELVVLGHSMGGNLAVGHTLADPDGIAALALSGPALKPGDDLKPIMLKVASLLSRFAPKLRPEGLDVSLISRDPAVVEAYRNDPLVYTGKMSAGIAGALLGTMQSFPARYGELEMPILIQHGCDDKLANVEGSRELERAAVKATVTSHYYDGLYHEIFNEPEQDAVLADLVTWLDDTV